jgi:hypothetical protein
VKTCPSCGRVFSRPPDLSHSQWEGRTFCSNLCRGASIRKERRLCGCGCGQRVAKTTSFYRQGHAPRARGGIALWHPPGRKPRYVFRDRQGKNVYYARAVMAAHLRRDLLPTEVVDHANGDSTDDRIENLRLFSSHAEHMRCEYERGVLVLN